MIYAISGKPGGGKSYYATKLLVEQLLTTNRLIVTNLAVNLVELSVYVRAKGREDVNVFERIVFLTTDEEIKQFFRIRTLDKKAVPAFNWVSKKDVADQNNRLNFDANPAFRRQETNDGKLLPLDAKIEKIDMEKEDDTLKMETLKEIWKAKNQRDVGVAYFIDEIQLLYNVRTFAETGQMVIFYMSQHRKLNDYVVWITQSVQAVDKSFRYYVQEYIYLRNLNKEMLNKWIRRESTFRRYHYPEPLFSNPQQIPQITQDEKPDPEIFKLYDTSAGVGMSGGAGAETSGKKRGLPLKFIYVVIFSVFVICIALVWLSPGLIQSQTRQWFGKKTGIAIPAEDNSVEKNKKNAPSADFVNYTATGGLAPVAVTKDADGLASQHPLTIFTPNACPAHILVQLAKTLYPIYTYQQISQNHVAVLAPKEHIEDLKRLDIPRLQLSLRLQVHTLKKSKEAGFSVDSLLSSINISSGFSMQGTALKMDFDKVLASAKLGNATYEGTDTFSLVCYEGMPNQLTRGIQIAIPTTTVSNGVSQTSFTFKDILSTLSFDFTGNALAVTANLQQLTDASSNTIATSSLLTTIPKPTVGNTYLLSDISQSFSSNSRGLFWKEKQSQEFIYLLTLKID